MAAGRILGLAFAVLASSSACSSDPPPAQAAPPAVLPPAPATSEPPGTAPETTTTIDMTTTTRKPRRVPAGPPGPLTGTPVDLPGYERRPALVVKIDNYDPGARPQAGLSLADVIYEQKVEGPISRFAAVFHGADADLVGPVRSARSTDIPIVGPMNRPMFAYSGANGGFLGLLADAPLLDVGANRRPGAYWRGGDKPMPHNLYTRTSSFFTGATGDAPPPLWPFRGIDDPPGPGARPAISASYHFGGGMNPVDWRWDPAENGWVRSQNGTIDFDMDNWPVTVANLVIHYALYVDSIAADMVGNPVPEAALGGEGKGWVLTGDAAIPMTWSRWSLDSATIYAGPDGEPIRFKPGRTWVALQPEHLRATIRFANGTVAS